MYDSSAKSRECIMEDLSSRTATLFQNLPMEGPRTQWGLREGKHTGAHMLLRLPGPMLAPGRALPRGHPLEASPGGIGH